LSRDAIAYLAPLESGAPSASAIFVGEVATSPLEPMPGASDLRALCVRFSAGAHTKLHTHSSEQVLIVVEGEGHVGAPGADRVVRVGDIVRIPAGTVHYHGAGPDGAFAHVALLAGTTDVLEDALAWPPGPPEGPVA